MAANTGTRKRDPIKYVRDKAKSAYEKMPNCFICGTTEELELHHTSSLTNLFEKWTSENSIDISTDEAVVEVRDEFIEKFHKEIYEEVFTLCLKHHQKLHSIYGKAPLLSTASKQVAWIHKQRDKFNGLDTEGATSKYSGEIKSSTGSNSTGGWLQYRVKPASYI